MNKHSGQLDHVAVDETHVESLPSNNELQIKVPEITAFLEASSLIGNNTWFELKRKPRRESIIVAVSVEGKDMSSRQDTAIQLEATLILPNGADAVATFNVIKQALNELPRPDGDSPYNEFYADETDGVIIIETPNQQVLLAYPDPISQSLHITNKGTLPTGDQSVAKVISVAPDSFDAVSSESQVIDFCLAATELTEIADTACLFNKRADKPTTYKFNLQGLAKDSQKQKRRIGRSVIKVANNAPSIPDREKLDDTALVSFNDIAGYEKQIERLKRLITINKHPEYAKARFGLDPTKGILIEGPAGTGKTTLAKACATELGANLIVIGNEDVIAPNIGESSRNLDRILREAYAAGEPLVVLFESIDAILGTGNVGTDKGMVATFKKHVQDDSDHDVLIIGTAPTGGSINSSFDLASLFETRISLSLPNVAERSAIFAQFITDGVAKIFEGSFDRQNVPNPLRTNEFYRIFDDFIDVDELARHTHGFSGSDIHEVIKLAKNACYHRDTKAGDLTLISRADILEAINAYKQQ